MSREDDLCKSVRVEEWKCKSMSREDDLCKSVRVEE